MTLVDLRTILRPTRSEPPIVTLTCENVKLNIEKKMQRLVFDHLIEVTSPREDFVLVIVFFYYLESSLHEMV